MTSVRVVGRLADRIAEADTRHAGATAVRTLRAHRHAFAIQAVAPCARMVARRLDAAAGRIAPDHNRGTSSPRLLRLFRSRPSDIYIAAYPKSGATLMQMMLYQLTSDGEMNFTHIHCKIPYLEHALRSGHSDWLAQLPSPRVFKTHWRWETLDAVAPGCRYIYLLRDPADVLVSAYYHLVLTAGIVVPIEWYLARFFLTTPLHGAWADHTRSWWPHRLDENVLFLRYEDIVADRTEAARKVASACGASLNEDVVRRVEERCAIAFMRAHDAKFDPRTITTLEQPPTFVRRGRTHAWREAMPYVEPQVRRQILAVTDALPDDHAEALRSELSDWARSDVLLHAPATRPPENGSSDAQQEWERSLDGGTADEMQWPAR